MTDHPRLLRDFEPAPGTIKTDYEDFHVEEVPLYPADGAGAHTYFVVEKRGLSSMQAARDIARALNVRQRDIGMAGLKDARAVTRQWMSVEHVEPNVLAALEIPRIRILQITRHGNKLRLGHLKENRFVIKVRDAAIERFAELEEALATLAKRGVPNYFGEQRFGNRGDTWRTGRAIVRNNLEEAVDLVLGRPSEDDHGGILEARRLYEKGKYEPAINLWPYMFRDERVALKTLARTGKKKRAFLAIHEATRQFYVSAYQSYLFNKIVAARLADGWNQLWVGDLAWRHLSGAVFKVVDPAVEQPRMDSFEISPSGPLFGYRMTTPEGRAAEMEAAALKEEELTPEMFHTKHLRISGGRRPLRFRPANAALELGADERGAYLKLSFALQRGCYATAVLRELFREAPPADAEPELDFAEA